MRSASFALPAGYELSSDNDGAALMAGPGGVIFVVDDAAPTAIGEMQECFAFAHGVGTSFLANLLERPSLKVVAIEATAYRGTGCRVDLAPAADRPAVFSVAVAPFGERVVIVMCSVGDPAQADACAAVRDSLTACKPARAEP